MPQTTKKSSGNEKSETASKKVSMPSNSGKAASNGDGKLNDLFLDSIKDIFWAEKHLIKVLPKMKKAATSPDLAKAFEDHLNATKEHVSRLEEVFGLLGKKAVGKKCEAMEGLTKEGESIIEETEAGSKTRDVGLIMAAQKVEHYEIATYGSLATLADMLGYKEIKALLGQTLDEEKQTDELLTKIAEGHINKEAMSEGD